MAKSLYAATKGRLPKPHHAQLEHYSFGPKPNWLVRLPVPSCFALGRGLPRAFKERFPDVQVQCAKVQESDFFGRTYHAAVAVGLLFLLPECAQLALIERVAQILVPGGRFLFTAPIEAGSWSDLNTGIACHSLGQARYETCLNAAGFRVAAAFVDKGENNYYDAERTH